MRLVFEKVCRDYLMLCNAKGELPFLFTSIGRWWGTGSDRSQIEIDLVANDGRDYLICECKWRNELLDLSVLKALTEKVDAFNRSRENTWYILFSKSGFTDTVKREAQQNQNVLLFDLNDILNV